MIWVAYRGKERPIAAIRHAFPTLRCGPLERAFAAHAKSQRNRTHGMRDIAGLCRAATNDRYRNLSISRYSFLERLEGIGRTVMADLIDLCEIVHDEVSFIVFLDALMADFKESRKIEAETPSSPYGAAANGWENTTIDGFLEAAVSWAHDVPPEDENPWRRVANILYAGKIYE